MTACNPFCSGILLIKPTIQGIHWTVLEFPSLLVMINWRVRLLRCVAWLVHIEPQATKSFRKFKTVPIGQNLKTLPVEPKFRAR